MVHPKLIGWLAYCLATFCIFSFFQTPLPQQEGPKSNSLSTFEMMPSRDIAYLLTSYDHELFGAINIVSNI